MLLSLSEILLFEFSLISSKSFSLIFHQYLLNLSQEWLVFFRSIDIFLSKFLSFIFIIFNYSSVLDLSSKNELFFLSSVKFLFCKNLSLSLFILFSTISFVLDLSSKQLFRLNFDYLLLNYCYFAKFIIIFAINIFNNFFCFGFIIRNSFFS